MNWFRLALLGTLILALNTLLWPQAEGFVATRGPDVISADGKPLLLRGINLGNWLVPEGYMFLFRNASSPRLMNDVITQLVGPDEARMFWSEFRANYITRQDIRYIRSIGLNSVRVPFNYRLLSPEDRPDEILPSGFALLDSVVTWCREEGLLVVFDMHCAPAGQTGDNIDDSWGYPFLFESPESQEQMIMVWRAIAARYENERAIIGYDLMNEPIAHYFDTERLNPLLEPLYRRIVAAIREVDTNHIVFLGGARWNTDFSVFGKVFDSKAVYTFHKYWMPPTQESIQEYVDFRQTFNVPVWMGESGENTDGWVDSFRVVLEKNDIGWCFWPYKRMDATRCVRQVVRPAGWDVISEYADKPRSSFAEIRDLKPDRPFARKVLKAYLQAMKFENCMPNGGYIKALGLNEPK